MEMLTFDIMAVIANSVLSFALLGAVVWMSRRTARQQKVAAARISALENELRALTSGALGVGKKLLTVEQRIRETEKRTQELSLSDPVKVSYNEAARLLELGADVDDLIANCGLSRPEAELVSALHRQRSAA